MQTLAYLGIIFFSASVLAKDYTGYKVIRAYPKTTGDVEFLYKLMDKHDFWTTRIRLGRHVDINVAPEYFEEMREIFSARNLRMHVIHEDVQALVNASKPGHLKSGQRLDWYDYYSYSDIDAFLEEVASEVDFVELITVGTSFEDRPIRGVHINPGGSTHKVWIDGGIHAREWISPAVVTYYIEQIARNYEENQELVDAFDWYIVPLQNPDGYEFTRSDDRLWRKNRNSDHHPSCRGVDLNRNWDFHWMESGTSTNPCSLVFGGPEPESEPEVQAVRDYILGLGDVKIFLSHHSYSQVWLCPWGYGDYERPDDYDDLVELMRPSVEALESVYGTNYLFGTAAEVLGSASGASDDWAKGVAMIKHSYTLELRDTGYWGFELPPEQILPTSVETWEGVKVAVALSKEIQ